MINSLPENHIFVFGSNLQGIHRRGAAKDAVEHFGAVMYRGEGLQGQSYAFPTKRTPYESCSIEELLSSVAHFVDCAKANPQLTFILTKVGCGLAGFTEQYMRELFLCFPIPSNVLAYENWVYND